MPGLKQLSFAQLRTRVIVEVRRRIRNGEFTERGLARMAGLSQPHLHNVLKGVRDLTPAVGDALLATLDFGLSDLLAPDELAHAVESLQSSNSGPRIIPILEGKIGPGFPLPDLRQPVGFRAVPTGLFIAARRPAFAQLAPDQELATVYPKAKLAVVDFDDLARLRPELPHWYVIRHTCGGLVRQVRIRKGWLEILGQNALWGEPPKRDVPLGSTSLLQLVRARVVWAGNYLEWPLPNA